jgi:hypothetical protein
MHRELVYRPLQFQKRSRQFIGTHDETLSVAMHVYQVRLRKDYRGVDLISDALPFGRLWYDRPDNAIGYAITAAGPHDADSRLHDAGNVIETDEPRGWF